MEMRILFLLATNKNERRLQGKIILCTEPWGLWWNKITQNLQMLKPVITSIWCCILSSFYNTVKWPVIHIAKLACMALWRYHLPCMSAVARVTSPPTTVLQQAIQIKINKEGQITPSPQGSYPLDVPCLGCELFSTGKLLFLVQS